MRSLQEAETRWAALTECRSLSELGDAVNSSPANQHITDGLRSACWKAFLLFQNTNLAEWPEKLQHTRDAYESLRSRFLYALQHPDETDTSLDPLSDDLDSPWDALRKDEALRQEINQDVERCMPDNLYFRRPETQNMLLDILFVWAKLNPDIRYRQGMHEILAPILWVVERDAVDQTAQAALSKGQTNTNIVAIVFDAEFVGHDSFTLFTQIMKDAKSSYEVSDRAASTGQRLGRGNDSAIVARSRRIVEDYLSLADPPLASHLKDIDIVPQLFLMRWIRLLFGREFSFDQMLQLWDRLFVVGNTTEHVDLICVAMLLRIRWFLIDADYNTTLQYLLRYPEQAPDQSPSSLVDDAIFLKRRLDFDGGCEVIKLRTGKSPPLTNRPIVSPALRSQGSPPPRPSLPIRDRFTGSPRGIESLINDAARGINMRGERWGVYKAVREVAGEVRKNVSTIQSKTHSRMHSFGGSIEEQSTEDQLLRRIEALQTRNQSLARMLEGAVSELWQQHATATNEKSITDKEVEAFTTSIAKVQFVQIYLEDSSLDLPSRDPAFDPVSPEIQPKVRDQTATPPRRLPTPALAVPSAQNASEVKPTEENPRNTPPAAEISKTSETKVDVSSSLTPDRKLGQRPALAQSSFSWMLGQEPHAATPRSTFVSASPFSDQSSRTKRTTRASTAFLFGDEDDGAFESSTMDKSSGGALVRAKEDSEDDYRLGTLRGKP